MMNDHENNHLHPEATPAEVHEVAGLLDALAVRDQASAPAGFEDRLLAATRGSLGSQRSNTAMIGMVHTRNPWAGLRLAAMLAIVGGVGLLGTVYMIASRNQPTTGPGASGGQITQAQRHVDPSGDEPLNIDEISAEFEDYLASVKGTSSDLSDSSDASSGDGFWEVGNALTLEGSL